MTNKQRRGMWALVAIFFLLGFPISYARADTPTPTPTRTPIATPTALPPGFNSNSNFAVDNSVELPWPLPLPPTFPVASATPTLYNATPAHATGYPAQVSTATAQVAQFTGPIDSISTPVAQMIGTGPTPVGGELNTGVDAGTGTITFSGFAEDIGDTVGPVIGTMLGFLMALYGLAEFTPAIGIIIVAEVVALIIGLFLALIPIIIKAGEWIVNFVIRLFTLIGSFTPG